MNYPSSGEDDDRPSAKRAKVFRACAQCVTAKTRCEDVKAKGCWLCRRKRKDCSLAGAISEAPSPPVARNQSYSDRGDLSRRGSVLNVGPSGFGMPSEGPMAVMSSHHGRPAVDMMGGPSREMVQLSHAEARITASEHRIAALERELQDLRTVLPSGPQPSYPGIRNTGHPNTRTNSFDPSSPTDQASRSGKILHIARLAQLEDFNETIFSLGDADNFPSVVTAGILQPAEVDLAFQSFKHHFSTILPLSPFLSIGTPTPTHNFVVLACLHHVPACPSAQLVDLVDKSIIAALAGNTSVDVVLAFLILALAPTTPSKAGEATRPTPLRLISMAYQLGRDLGLDAKVQGYIERGSDLVEPFWAEPLWIVQLWTAVVNRYIIFHLLHAHGRPLPLSSAPHIPRSPISMIQQTTDHLVDEYHLAEIARRTMQPLMAVEAGLHDFDDVKRSMQEFQSGMEELTGWRRNGSSVSLDLDQRCLEHIAVSRLSFLFQRIPSPLQPIRQTLIAGMDIFIVTAQRFLATLFPDANAPVAEFSPHFLRPLTSQSGGSQSQSPYGSPRAPTIAPEVIFPAHVSTCLTLAVLSIRGTAAHVRHKDNPPQLNEILHLDRVMRVEAYLRKLGGQTAAALLQADEAFGTLEEMIRVSLELDRARAGASASGAYEGGGAMGSGGAGMGTGGQSWDHGDPLMSSGLFDFDLFSWDPSYLAPDWIPATPAGGMPHQGLTPGGGGTGMMGPPGPASTEDVSAHQEMWKNAMR